MTSIITSPQTWSPYAAAQTPSQLGPPLTFRASSASSAARIRAPSPLRESALARSPEFSHVSHDRDRTLYQDRDSDSDSDSDREKDRERTRECYLSPSNPFSFCRQPVFSPNRRRKVHFSPPTATHLRLHARLVPPPPPSPYALAWCRLQTFLEDRCAWTAEEMWDAAVQAVFWMCVVVFVSSLYGAGYSDRIHIDTTQPPLHGHVPSRAYIRPSPAVGYQTRLESIVGGFGEMDIGIVTGPREEGMRRGSMLGMLSHRAEDEGGSEGFWVGSWEGIWEGERKARR